MVNHRKMPALSRRNILLGLAGLPFLGSRSAFGTITGEMLIYCGITMVKPIKEIAGIMEQRLGLKINISQGASEDLYEALKVSRVGDIYFPGSPNYRTDHLPEGLLGKATPVGYNVASLMTQRGNPKKIKADIRELLRPDLSVVICDPDTGSIGAESKQILDRAGIFQKVLDRSAYLTTDSRNLMQSLKNKDSDLALNWRATAFFPENRAEIEVLDLDPAIAMPKKLELSQLTFTKRPQESSAFMEYAASADGQAIFRKYGFLDANMKGDF